MKIFFNIALILLLPISLLSQKKIAFAPAPVNFIIKNAGFNVNGSMTGLDASVTMDGQNANPAKIEGTIDPNTIHTGITMRDNHLKKHDYFNVKDFLKILIVSTEIKKTANNKYVGNFDLTIKDIKKSIVVPFVFSAANNSYSLKGEFTINRLDFKLGESSIILSDSVKIKIDFTATDK